MAAAEALSDPEALAAEWDLSPLVNGNGDAGVDVLLDDAAARTTRFADAYASRVAELDATGLTQAMHELSAISELIQRASVYAQLRFATDSSDSERSALAQGVKERSTELETQLVFFSLEWTALDPRRAELLLAEAGDDLEFAAQYLRTQQRRRPHTLSAPEERLMAERRLTGEQAWARLFEELAGGLKVELEGEEVPYSAAYTQLMDPNSAKRKAAMEAMASGMPSGLNTRTYVFNTLLYDKAVEDRLRGYPTWLTSRNIENQTDDRSVQALIEAVVARYDIPARWCRLKAGLLGTDRLAESDLYGPVLADETTFPYGEARDLVLASYSGFSPQVGAVARRFFDENWIDAPIRPNKMAGAFCETGGPNLHPYVLLNHSGRRYDVFAMAHELGHGIHDVLSARAGVFHQLPTMPVAETASTFGESLLLESMLGQASTERERLSLLAAAVDRSLMTIFLQVAFNQFEERVHTARRTEGELSSDRIDQIYRETTQALYGDSVEWHPGMESFWSMIPHFFLWPGYVYAYAFGELFSLSLFARYRALGASFVPSYLELLAAGGSRPPEELGRIVGVDLSETSFWASGLELVDAQLRAVEELAAATDG
ncbi:MAG TPA: M3 family oligoendopeptidase [Solirubrobacteraceae bacterium]|jgi:oligoendopeptidase F|nr:M3 family oligoendopeptidase [Solirubrobacteraceae bacterium]